MNIQDAIIEARKKGTRIRNKDLYYYDQDAKSLAYWILWDKTSTKKQKLAKLKTFLDSTDWETEK